LTEFDRNVIGATSLGSSKLICYRVQAKLHAAKPRVVEIDFGAFWKPEMLLVAKITETLD